MQTNLIVSGSSFKACKDSELDITPPLLTALWLLVESPFWCGCTTECSMDELLWFSEETVSTSSVISSITKPIKQASQKIVYLRHTYYRSHSFKKLIQGPQKKRKNKKTRKEHTPPCMPTPFFGQFFLCIPMSAIWYHLTCQFWQLRFLMLKLRVK